MHFKIGEKVSYLNEVGEGIVKDYLGNGVYLVADIDTGFEMHYKASLLVKRAGEYDLGNAEFFKKNQEKNFKKDKAFSSHIRKLETYWEIDLHTQAFMETEKNFSNGELLERQLYEFQSFFTESKAAYIRKLIVIHGVGKGTLKNEIRHFLKGRENIEFFDASYKDYGKGATEIRIYYKN